MWFPDYGRPSIELLLGASGGDIWVAVEELLLMEGEEPYRERIAGPLGRGGRETAAGNGICQGPEGGDGRGGAATAPGAYHRGRPAPALTDTDFPSLGSKEGKGVRGGAANVAAASVPGSWGGQGAKSAKEALLRPAAAAAAASSFSYQVGNNGAGKHSDRGRGVGGKGAAVDGSGRLAAAVERLLGRSGLAFRKLQDGLFEIS